MAITRILETVPASEVDEVVDDFESEGAVVTKERTNGSWTVIATFPEEGGMFRPREPSVSIDEVSGGATSELPAKAKELAPGYEELFETCTIMPDKVGEVDSQVSKLLQNKATYDNVGQPLGIPWWFIGIIHSLESSFNLNTHLHNGDPLTERTKRVPKNRPVTGSPPFSWAESAEDALKLQKLDQWNHWPFEAGVCFPCEVYNGMGYRKVGINSPYLWSFTNHYTKGKFIADGLFDSEKVSKQCGAMAMLRVLVNRGEVQLDKLPA